MLEGARRRSVQDDRAAAQDDAPPARGLLRWPTTSASALASSWMLQSFLPFMLRRSKPLAKSLPHAEPIAGT